MANEVDEFLDGLKGDESIPFEESTEDPFSSGKPKEMVETPEGEEKPLPFHKDPKVQRYVEKAISKALEGVKPTETARFIEETGGEENPELIAVLTRIVGNDTPEKISAVKDLTRALSGLEEKGAQRALEQIERQQESVREEEREAVAELRQGLEEIEDEFGVDILSDTPQSRKTRVDFLNYVTRIAPKNEEGVVTDYPDITAAFEDFQTLRKNVGQPNRAKDLASRSMSRSADASNVPASTDKSWKAVDKLFSKLTK